MTGMFFGTGTAIVTPFSNEKVDYQAFERLISLQLQAKTDALVVAGTTGEASTLTGDEKTELIGRAKAKCGGKIPVIAGAGSNSTKEAVQTAENMEKAGADAILCITPYYNLANQEGLKAHFTAVADAIGIPVILYNVPSRTGVSLEAETAAQLFRHPRIRGVKEAASDFEKAAKMTSLALDGAYVYCGNDIMTVSEMALGACGVISVVSNIAPGRMRAVTSACLSGDFARARKEYARLLPLIEALRADINPIPVKAALSVLGLIQNEVRLPLTPLSAKKMKALESLLNREDGIF